MKLISNFVLVTQPLKILEKLLPMVGKPKNEVQKDLLFMKTKTN
jgi:hypothetical protein